LSRSRHRSGDGTHLPLARLPVPFPPAPATAPAAVPVGLGGLRLGFLKCLIALLPSRLLVLLGLEEVGRVEKGALFQPYVNECGLDARKDCLDPAEIDVADDAAVIRPVDEQLDQTVVLEDGHAGFPLAPVDKNLALHAFEPRPGQALLAPPAGGVNLVTWS
jgi:hypothetical protein